MFTSFIAVARRAFALMSSSPFRDVAGRERRVACWRVHPEKGRLSILYCVLQEYFV